MQAKGGQSSAFGELYQRRRLKIYRSAFRILRHPQDAEDAVQQSFQRAFTNLNRFREDSAFATWMTRIVINEALMMLRRRRVTTPLFESDDDVNLTSPIDLADDHPTPEQAYAKKESRAVVTNAISRLRKSLRTVALLRELQGLSNAETARRGLRKHLEGKHTARRRDFRSELKSRTVR